KTLSHTWGFYVGWSHPSVFKWSFSRKIPMNSWTFSSLLFLEGWHSHLMRCSLN
ncbi:hypothetical protein KIL84_017619, partial [Mauremys mutica]